MFTIASPAISTRKSVLFLAFTVITVAPLFITHAQWLTGPLVNAMLILTCVLVGPAEAVMLGLFPSAVALSSGLLPLPLAPMVPFIMIGNALFVTAFHWLRLSGFFPALLVASVLKFAFLALTVRLLMTTMLADPLVATLSVMMSWPQLVTALLGGVLAYVVIRFTRIHA